MNPFKSNTRVKNIDEYDSNYYSDHSFRNNNNRQHSNQFSNKFKAENKEPIKKDFVMEENAFPDLIKSKKNDGKEKEPQNTESKSFSFVSLLTDIKLDSTEPTIVEDPNLAVFTFNKKNHIMSVKYGKKVKTNIVKNKTPEETEEEIKKEKQFYANKILNKLTDLHIQRTDNYIETWGQEAYIDRYICPNYDYEYFDKLDELYEKEMIAIMEQELMNSNNTYSENYQEYQEYQEYQTYYD